MIHILIADDDPHIRELVRFYLEAEGYSVVEAADGGKRLTALPPSRSIWLSLT